jgi:hypothetical protein
VTRSTSSRERIGQVVLAVTAVGLAAVMFLGSFL